MRVAGINFDHFHMGDLLRMVTNHPEAEIVGICDETPGRMEQAAANFSLTAEQVFTDYRECLERTRPDLVILCPATAAHARWVEMIAPFGVHILMEKPMAATLAEIKSRMLLPRPAAEGEEEADPRAELVRRLQEYERFKRAAIDIEELISKYVMGKV